jgi:hypothetical protein
MEEEEEAMKKVPEGPGGAGEQAVGLGQGGPNSFFWATVGQASLDITGLCRSCLVRPSALLTAYYFLI